MRAKRRAREAGERDHRSLNPDDANE
jgi:hypothetical protein